MHYHLIARRPGGQKKTVTNKTEDQILAEFVVPYLTTGTIKAKWGNRTHSYQVLELQIYGTTKPFNKKAGVSLESFLKNKKNQFGNFEEKAKKSIGIDTYRVFVIMPIQGEKFGTQEEQRIFREYDERFTAIEQCLSDFDCVSIRIDKEHPLEDLVGAIKKEIRKANFVIADLTDERPSCYFEAGYAEAQNKPVIYCASKDSVGNPGVPTKVHFDVHMNVNFFTNHEELQSKLKASIEKNKDKLMRPDNDKLEAVLS